MESPFESFSTERILSRLDALAEKEGQSIAIWSSIESISFSELRSELESRAHGHRSKLEASGLSHLPLEVGMSLASHLDTLSCFVFGVPFCLIDETFPNARKQQLVDLLLPQKAVAKELKRKSEDLVAIGEISLAGEIRSVTSGSQRSSEAKRLGFNTIIDTSARSVSAALRTAMASHGTEKAPFS